MFTSTKEKKKKGQAGLRRFEAIYKKKKERERDTRGIWLTIIPIKVLRHGKDNYVIAVFKEEASGIVSVLFLCK